LVRSLGRSSLRVEPVSQRRHKGDPNQVRVNGGSKCDSLKVRQSFVV
jgi:hypothetical protein